MAFYLCFVPEGRPATLRTLIRVAGPRWPVEEDSRVGKDAFGLDHSQVRTYPALFSHLVLAMAALAVAAVTAAHVPTPSSPCPLVPPVCPSGPPMRRSREASAAGPVQAPTRCLPWRRRCSPLRASPTGGRDGWVVL